MKGLLFTAVFLFGLGASAQGGSAVNMPVGTPGLMAILAAVSAAAVALTLFALRPSRRSPTVARHDNAEKETR